ncbi:MAG: hypothetical protein WAM28_00270 [Chlamydiales bacterium]
MKDRVHLLFAALFLLTACHRAPRHIEPIIEPPPHIKQVHRENRNFLCLPKDFSLSPFPPLTHEEANTEWGKEYRIALAFAEDFDLYRAITGFKRALYFLPPENTARYLEIQYASLLAYYLGKKHVEVVYIVESTPLGTVDNTFPAFSDLLLILYDSYERVGKTEHAQSILQLIEQNNPDHAQRLTLLSAIKRVDIEGLEQEAKTHGKHAYFENVMRGYKREAKSIRKAEVLNALLPGAGYAYVGLKGTAVTAFLVNFLFTAAATHFFLEGNTAAGAVILSLEGGWYLGGIYGGGLAAKYYNERLYCKYAEKITQREQLFPLLMLKYSF